MLKFKCASSNSVSHFIVILLYPNGFHVCTYAFDEQGSDSFTGVARLSCRLTLHLLSARSPLR